MTRLPQAQRQCPACVFAELQLRFETAGRVAWRLSADALWSIANGSERTITAGAESA